MDTQIQHDLNTANDLSLITLCGAGNLKAFDVLMKRHNQQLYRAARSILHDEAEAEDAVQEAWWKAFQHLQDFRADAQAATWLTRIAVNEALMRRRRNKSRETIIQSAYQVSGNSDNMLPPGATLPAPESSRPDQSAWRAELRHNIEQQIDALPDIYRTVFMLRGVEEMSATEVAQVLDIPEATVRVRFMRARHLLQAAMKHDFDPKAASAFSFAGERCARIVAGVHARMRAAGLHPEDEASM
ncbi:RNA polymerase sigma factor [Castellaniella caeni]|uniref:RNA polymerase sigma factor n=1 Tax=Castellaniella caeni TaxID=266123 RepID=UPI00083260BB|nr:RNA polymerase sigma factor [Castellaniella caeni]